MTTLPVRLFLPALALLCASSAARAQITLHADLAKSELRIELGKAGLFKALGDDHRILARDYRCEVTYDEKNLENSSVRLTVPAAKLEVTDPWLSAEKRAEVQKKMEGPDVLDAGKYAEIRFVSRKITEAGAGRFQVEGDLTIRDATRPVKFDLVLRRPAGARVADGEARVRLTTFGIQPPSAGAGTVKVKDEMRIVFQLTLVPAQP